MSLSDTKKEYVKSVKQAHSKTFNLLLELHRFTGAKLGYEYDETELAEKIREELYE